jgi:hypothetical protein
MKAEFRKAIAPFAPPARKKLEELHRLVMSTARELEGVGTISEELRWGQPSFLTPETGSGSTIRMDGLRNDPKRVALYFHCQSGLVPQFRELYSNKLTFEKDRAILLPVDKPLPCAELAHCISLALTHHLRKKPASTRRKAT